MRFLRLLVLAVALAVPAAAPAATTLRIPELRLQVPDFDRLERELRLKPFQRAQFDIAVAALRRALFASAGSLMDFKAQLADELLRPRPDFLALLERQRAAYELAAPLYREALDEWARLYALLEDDQVVIAKRFLREALEGFR